MHKAGGAGLRFDDKQHRGGQRGFLLNFPNIKKSSFLWYF